MRVKIIFNTKIVQAIANTTSLVAIAIVEYSHWNNFSSAFLFFTHAIPSEQKTSSTFRQKKKKLEEKI